MNRLFASTNFGTERLLEKELLSLGAKNIKIIQSITWFKMQPLA